MSIKLAFSTVACPDWPMEKVVEQAKQIGYEGVEIRTLGAGGSGLASDPALSTVTKTAALFEKAGIKPVCLSTSLAMHYRQRTPAHRAAIQLGQDLELAAALGCRYVRIFGNEVEPGQNRRTVIQRIASRVKVLADQAAHHGVQILFENAGSFNHAKEWWWLLNILDHPMVGLCWNVANAAAAGESPIVSVPNLHSRIRLAKVKDISVGEGAGFVSLGDGTVGIELFIKRLLGVGFDGFVSVEWDRLWLPTLASPEQYLPDAYQRLRGWIEAIEELEEKGRKVAERVAKKNAPKSAAAL